MRVALNRTWLGLASASLLVTACAATPRPGSGPFSPTQIAAMQRVGFNKSDRGWELSVADRLLFPTDSADVRPEQVAVIGQMTHALADVGIRHVDVEGHTDRTGTVRHNDALSVRRAGAVADVIIASGLRREDVKVVGLGQRYPVETNDTAAGRRENRRVVILITAP